MVAFIVFSISIAHSNYVKLIESLQMSLFFFVYCTAVTAGFVGESLNPPTKMFIEVVGGRGRSL